MFAELLKVLKEQVTVVTCRTMIKQNSDKEAEMAAQKSQNVKLNAVHESPVNTLNGEPEKAPTASEKKPFDPNDPATWGKIARNDLCPCGSGKKYKHCHGKIA